MRAAFYLVLLGLDVFWIEHTPTWISGPWWVALLGGAWLLFFLAAAAVSRTPKKAATALILLGGIGLPLAAGFAPPRSSDDLYRYVWDGRVQAHGIDPYRYAPADPELAPLRDDFLWPETSAWCVPSGCTLINRPTVHTIYPPVAQAYFAGLHYLSPKGMRERPAQLAATAFVVATTVLLLMALPRLGLNRRLAAVWAFCPLVALEAGNNAHVDVLAAFLTAAALLVLARARGFGRSVAGGGLLGLAVAVKLTPALVVPSALRRRPFVVAAAVALATAAVYLPHVLAVGPRALGYLPGYLADEGYANGDRFALLTLVLPARWAPVAAIAILAATACWAWAKTNPDRPWDTAVVTAGVALIVASSGYAWYGMLLVVLVALSARYEWLAVTLAGYVTLYAHEVHLSGHDAQVIGYGSAAVIVAAAAAYRWRRARGPIRPITASPQAATLTTATAAKGRARTSAARSQPAGTRAAGTRAAGTRAAGTEPATRAAGTRAAGTKPATKAAGAEATGTRAGGKSAAQLVAAGEAETAKQTAPKSRSAKAKAAKSEPAEPEAVKQGPVKQGAGKQGAGKAGAARSKAATARNKTQRG